MFENKNLTPEEKAKLKKILKGGCIIRMCLFRS